MNSGSTVRHGKPGRLYDCPRYYEIAFSFRDIPKEVSVFEECIGRFSKIPVKSFLELACGSAPHASELLKRGYTYTGIDLNRHMLDYTRKRIPPDANAELVQGNMLDFSLRYKADFAFVLLGSLYAANSKELSGHFDSVSRALRKGGLYLLDWCVEFDYLSGSKQSWTIKKGEIKVKTQVSYDPISLVEQAFEETITLNVSDHQKNLTIQEKAVRKMIHPQEFLLFIQTRKDFEFVGWWNNWNLDYPLDAWPAAVSIDRPVTLLRRV